MTHGTSRTVVGEEIREIFRPQPARNEKAEFGYQASTAAGRDPASQNRSSTQQCRPTQIADTESARHRLMLLAFRSMRAKRCPTQSVDTRGIVNGQRRCGPRWRRVRLQSKRRTVSTAVRSVQLMRSERGCRRGKTPSARASTASSLRRAGSSSD
jgi:hypothetical protein